MEVERQRKNTTKIYPIKRDLVPNTDLSNIVIKTKYGRSDPSDYRIIKVNKNNDTIILQRISNGTKISVSKKCLHQLFEDMVNGDSKRSSTPPIEQPEDSPKRESNHNQVQKALPSHKNLNINLDNKIDDTLSHIVDLINAGVKNIWMVGPAGCGKTTIGKLVAEKLKRDYYIISCGIGTSSTEFLGYKYPIREATRFATFYQNPSIIILDEFTALDPSVAQSVNAALANGIIETTTGIAERHPDCIIIATSNTYGSGASRQYCANNQLDDSTKDRFIGGIVEVDYNPKYESKFDSEVVKFVQQIRDIIKNNELRRVASTRMIIEGEKLRKANIKNWTSLLVSNWTEEEKQLLIAS